MKVFILEDYLQSIDFSLSLFILVAGDGFEPSVSGL